MDLSESVYGGLTHERSEKRAVKAAEDRANAKARARVPNREMRRRGYTKATKAGARRRDTARKAYAEYIASLVPYAGAEWVSQRVNDTVTSHAMEQP